MQINKEPRSSHSIQSYADHELKINGRIYDTNIIVCRNEIIENWLIKDLTTLDNASLTPLLNCRPEVIIIGHNQLGMQPPMNILETLSQKRLGLECMAIGAACRTFNVLLNEGRNVALGIIF